MNKSPPTIDAEVYWLRLEKSIETLRQQMLLSPAPKRQVYYGMALGILSAIRQAELISEADFIKRSDALTDDLGAEG
ncbi:hypothetical protein PS874_06293 [Pseudomonas fluorescens]|nr:hypothetical protein PS874_06293 [Pseudomonas fluorescens]